MTKEEFKTFWCNRMKITEEYFDEWYIVAECDGDCECHNCKGWIVAGKEDE